MNESQPEPEAVRTLVRHTFNAAADHFDDAPLFFWDHCGRRTVEIASVAPGDRVLDVCCGAGASALPAAERAGPTGRVIAVDIADRLLDRARSKAKQQRLENVDFVLGDLSRLGVLDGVMDVVVCVLGIYFARDLPSAVAELWRTVGRGGTLAVTTWGLRALEPAHSIFLRAVAEERPDLDLRASTSSWERINTAAALVRVFLEAGVPQPVIVRETVVRPLRSTDVWTIVLGSGYRLILDLMTADSVSRVRASVCRRVDEAHARELTADIMYARASRD